MRSVPLFAAVLTLAAAPAGAIPLLDLKPYPAPAAGEQRWVIQLVVKLKHVK